MIKNLILDFGDIFINLDKPATAKEMEKFGYKETTAYLDGLFKDYEKGFVGTDMFLERAQGLFPKASQSQLISAWNAILLDFPLYRLEFLETLAAKKRCRLFLLSNTNELHINHVKQKMGTTRWQRFENAFESFYLSYEMGMRKPDTEIFEFILKENYLKPAETLFVDDTKENTDAAASLGILTWNLKAGKEDIIDLKKHL